MLGGQDAEGGCAGSSALHHITLQWPRWLRLCGLSSPRDSVRCCANIRTNSVENAGGVSYNIQAGARELPTFPMSHDAFQVACQPGWLRESQSSRTTKRIDGV